MKKLFIIILMLILTVSIFAEIRKFTINNSIDIIYDYDKSYNISAITFFFDGGCLNYSPENAGIETFLLQAIQKGSIKYELNEYDRLIDRYGIHVNHVVNYDYSLIGYSSINKYFRESIDILVNAMKDPLLEEKTIDILKQKIIADLKQQKEQPDEIVWDELNEVFFNNHPYYASPKGKIETMDNITINDLRNHLNLLTKENRLVISIVSGIKPEEIIDYLSDELKTFNSPKKYNDFEVPLYEAYKGNRECTGGKDNLMTSYVAIKYTIPSILDNDYAGIRIGLSVLSRRVYEILRTKHGLTYAPFVGASVRKTNYGYFYVSTDYVDSALTLTFEEFENVKKRGVSQEEIDNIANQYETYFYMQNEKSLDKSNIIGSDYLLYNDWNHSEKFISVVKQIKPKDIKNLYNKYLNDFTIFVLEKSE